MSPVDQLGFEIEEPKKKIARKQVDDLGFEVEETTKTDELGFELEEPQIDDLGFEVEDEPSVSLGGYIVDEAFIKPAKTIYGGVLHGSADIADSLDFYSDKLANTLGIPETKDSIFETLRDHWNQTGSDLIKEGTEGEISQATYSTIGQAMPFIAELIAFKGLGPGALPAVEALAGGKEEGLIGAAKGATYGALLHGIFKGVGLLPSGIRGYVESIRKTKPNLYEMLTKERHLVSPKLIQRAKGEVEGLKFRAKRAAGIKQPTEIEPAFTESELLQKAKSLQGKERADFLRKNVAAREAVRKSELAKVSEVTPKAVKAKAEKPIQPSTLEQEAVAPKRVTKKEIKTILQEMRSELETSTAHGKISTAPEFFKGKGFVRKETLKVFDKMIKGEKIPEFHGKKLSTLKAVETHLLAEAEARAKGESLSLEKEFVQEKKETVQDISTGELDLKVGDQVKINDEWLDVTKHDKAKGEITLKDGALIKVDDTFDVLPVEGGEQYGVKKGIVQKPTEKKVEEKPKAKKEPRPAATELTFINEIEGLYGEAIDVAPTEKEANRLRKEFTRIKAISETPTPQEIKILRSTIKAWQNFKGITQVKFRAILKEVTGHQTLTHRDITGTQLKEVLAKMRKTRPAVVGGKRVIKKETERRIEELKTNLISREELTQERFDKMLKLHRIKVPKYISKRNFITETQAKDLIKSMLSSSRTIAKQVKIEKSLEKSPEIKKEVDKIETFFEKERAKGKPVKANTLQDARFYYQSLEEQTGEPFAQTYEDLNEKAAIANTIKNKKIGDVIDSVGQQKWKQIRRDKIALHRINNYIASDLPSYVIGTPAKPKNITADEIKIAKEISKSLKDFETDVRYLRFLEWYDKKIEKIPNASTEELAKATKVLETQGHDALRKYLGTRDWGVIKTGYDIGEVIKPTVRSRIKGVIGKGHLRSRESVHFQKYERDIVTRYVSYVNQMVNKAELEPNIRALEELYKINKEEFADPQAVAEGIKANISEFLRQREYRGFLGRAFTRAYSQGARAIFLDPRKGVRNLFQNAAFYTNPSDLLNQSKLSEEDQKYFNEFVSQKDAIKRDLMFIEEGGIPGLRKLNEWADAIDVMGNTDTINRLIAFKAMLGRVRTAIKNNPVFKTNNDALNKFQKESKFGELEPTQRKIALQTLSNEGQDAMARYVAKSVVEKVHFVYDRPQRGIAEQGSELNKVLSNLLTFRKGTAQRIIFEGRKLLPSRKSIETPFAGRKQAIRSLITVVVISAFIGELYKKITGDKRNPYRIDSILGDISLGGLATGIQEQIGNFTKDAIEAAKGDKAAAERVIKNIGRASDTFIPFYNDVINALEGLTDLRDIDIAILRQMRSELDKRYNAKPLNYYRQRRNEIEKKQQILFGTK